MVPPPQLLGATPLLRGWGEGRAAVTTPQAGERKSRQSERQASLAKLSRRHHRCRRLPNLPPLLPALFSVFLLLLAVGGRPTTAAEAEEPVLLAAAGKIPVAKENTAVAQELQDDLSEGLYFYISAKGPKRCFVVEGKGNIFHVHYDLTAAQDGEKVNLELRPLIESRPPRHRFAVEPIDTKVIGAEKGSHQFKIKSKKGATYSLCAVTSSKTKGPGLKLYLDLDTGKENREYDRVKKEFNLDDVQIFMIQLKNNAQQMLRTADYSKELETLYHVLLLQLNREVLWWPVSQVVILLIMGYYQVRHLKKFFKSKRLV